MEYTVRQKEYIDSVGGSAHASAVDIIGALDAECSSLKQRAWRADSRADEKWGLRKELAEALGVSEKCDDEALRAGLAAIRRLENERDDALARLDQYEDRNPVYPADLGRRTSNAAITGGGSRPVHGIVGGTNTEDGRWAERTMSNG